MARPKGSKNKARTVKASVDYVAVIAEKAAASGESINAFVNRAIDMLLQQN